MNDLQIARSVTLKHIFEVAQTLGIDSEHLISFGRYKAKVTTHLESRISTRPIGRYVLVTAINPTPLGEGKTTTAIGLSMGLCRLGHQSVVTLRQPSLGPVFGIKEAGREVVDRRCVRWRISICTLRVMRTPSPPVIIFFRRLWITISFMGMLFISIRTVSGGPERLV